jgi:hypothetical protein
MNNIERKLYELVNLLSEEGEIVKNKKTGNVYMVKSFDPAKHDKPSPAEVEKTKAANGGKIPTGETPSPKEKPEPKSTTPQQPKAQPTKIAAADFRTDAEKNTEKGTKPGVDLGKSFDKMKDTQTSAPKGAVTGDKLKDLMPNMDTTKKSVNDVPTEARKEAVTAIDKIAADLIKAKETGGKAENTNLCKVSVPGTNLYCDGNKNIPRDQMPQFRGKPEAGSEADKMPRDKNGEVETSQVFDKMLADQGIKVSEATPVPPDSLKATQSELVGPKVVGMMGVLDNDCNNQKCSDEDQQNYKNITDPIYVSNDGYVVDGHHRWAAIVSHNIKNPDKQIPMNVRVIDDKIDSIIPKANKFAQDIGIAAKSGKEGTKGGPEAAQTKPMGENKRIKLSSFLK